MKLIAGAAVLIGAVGFFVIRLQRAWFDFINDDRMNVWDDYEDPK